MNAAEEQFFTSARTLVNKLTEQRQGLLRSTATLCKLSDFTNILGVSIEIVEVMIHKLRDCLLTLDSRDREIADLKARLRETGAFVP